MKKALVSLFTIGAVAALAVGASNAYFTASDEAPNNSFKAGTMSLRITDQNTTTNFQNETIITNWQPGTDAIVNFDVLNEGTLPMHLRGRALGEWDNSALNPSPHVYATKVEYYDSGWNELYANSNGIADWFYYATGGSSSGTFFNLPAGARAQFRVTVHFDEDAGNEYQGETFRATLEVQGRQTTPSGAAWTQ